MTVTTPVRRMPATTRRVGYAIALAVNAAMLYVVNVSPGWQVVPVLTGDTLLHRIVHLGRGYDDR